MWSTVATNATFVTLVHRTNSGLYTLHTRIHGSHAKPCQVLHTVAVHLHTRGTCEHTGYVCISSRCPCRPLNTCCPFPFLLRYLTASCARDRDVGTLRSWGSTWQHAMHGGIDVDILQVLQGLCVEEAKRGPRGEGNPNADPSHSHVGDDHPLVLVGLQLILGE